MLEFVELCEELGSCPFFELKKGGEVGEFFEPFEKGAVVFVPLDHLLEPVGEEEVGFEV